MVETLGSIGINMFSVGCTERTSVVRTFRYYFVCLRCVVPVSMHYRLCLVTVRMKVSQKCEICQIYEGDRLLMRF